MGGGTFVHVYGPLIAGATSVLYEGLPTNPDPAIWWRICEQYGVRTMFSSPTGIRVLKKQDAAWLTRHDLSKLQWLFLAGEPLDEPTAHWITDGIGKTVIDNYWQTETGWPVLAMMPGLDMRPVKFGSPGLPMPGYKLRVINDNTGEDMPPGEKGVLVIEPPLPPGCLATVWRDDARFLSSYFSHFRELLYSSLDWAIRDADGYTFILGRTGDVINVAGHRLGTREIEESCATHPSVAEAAVIGVRDELKGQVPVVFATLKQVGHEETPEQAARSMQQRVVEQLGAVARPARVYVVKRAAEDAFGKAAAALVAGLGRAARSGRSLDSRRSGCAGGSKTRAGTRRGRR
jgi:propionyl-CoA synthetase